MDMKDMKDTDELQDEPLVSSDSPKDENLENGDYERDSQPFLPPTIGGMSRKLEKPLRKVQWNDMNGKKLVEVVEFERSDVSDSDEEDSDPCICTVM